MALREEWNRQDRARRRALNIMRTDSDLAGAILSILLCELREPTRGGCADLLREEMQAVAREVLASDLSGALDALGVRRKGGRRQ
jgi:hypothetical protein